MVTRPDTLLRVAMVMMALSLQTTAAFTPSLRLHPGSLSRPAVREVGRRFLVSASADDRGSKGATKSLPRRGALGLGFAAALFGGVPKASADPIDNYKLVQILKDCKDFGPVRFITVAPTGAVLESIGRLDYAYVPFEIAFGKNKKGQWVRIAGPKSQEKYVATFECSINLDNAAGLEFVTLDGPSGKLYCMRIQNKEGEKIITILLNYDIEGNGGKPGKYPDGSVERWMEVKKKYGDSYGAVSLLD
uniref:PsbP C-terminal domain-containing protein n=1 Tax=Hemiselmis andersenii TaxID=464988 RepID=A0A6U2DVM4_HEMAN|mmetsp:Transcript_25518/g.59159  ORF Transcript_25518/g.59159 Transcript_25518/m.59159 type:complete len:247 (+) Transcript_25518:198-938(+)|eukprot:CAMPEP_0114125970 /NCGR_PEP_ID=MMETSP0043_2-20121206/9580_1 /TAXON_ID=464988 /ORGANISM="Hemiselmis andersenii, Strain CCMP644" /LENGTH=246 /DNA_ID=CAMNT_0001218923 /DNA_START=286 /DNA_END=1026 /DNA_ORIENTATION=+